LYFAIYRWDCLSWRKSLIDTQQFRFQTHLNRDLSLAELANVINISNTLPVCSNARWDFATPVRDSTASGTGESDVVETDLGIADIAFQTGFQSKLSDATV